MRLAEVVAARMPGGRLATPDDNARILEFFDRAPMRTSAFALRYERAPDFFRLLRYQGDRAHVVLSLDACGAVRGIGTMSLRRGWLDGAPVTVGYLGDLRIGFDRAVVPHWRGLIADVVTRSAEIDELADCAAWTTTVLDDNHLARRALLSGRAGSPAYVPMAPFTMRNLVARLPFAGRHRAAHRWRVRRATAADAAQLADFFETRNARTPLGFRDELARRLAEWDGLAVESFVLAMDGEAIVACAAPWSPSRAKRTTVSRLPGAMRALSRAGPLLPRGRLRVPRAGEPLRTAYLTHLTFAESLGDAARPAACRAIVDHLFDRWGEVDWHCLAVADFAAWNLGRALGGYVQHAVPITVYAAGGRDAASAWTSCGVPPAFEMATV